MQQIIKKTIKRINGFPVKINGIFAGSGSSFANWFLTTEGSSKTLIQLSFPYSHQAVDCLLGRIPSDYANEQVANDFANIAYINAINLMSDKEKIIGIGCTSALRSDVEKKGEHRAYVSIRTEKEMFSYVLKMHKGFRDRPDEERLVSKFILNCLVENCFGEDNKDLLAGLSSKDEVFKKQNKYYGDIETFLKTNNPILVIDENGRIVEDVYQPSVIISGSFNPLHKGHKELVYIVEQMIGSKVDFEISIFNVDKCDMKIDEISQRISQFRGVGKLIISTAKTFVEKSLIFKDCSFVVGWDTAVRIINPKYYGNDSSLMLSALADIKKNKCDFIVAGRVDQIGDFKNLTDIDIPKGYEDMFLMIKEKTFRNDISSTEIRVRS